MRNVHSLIKVKREKERENKQKKALLFNVSKIFYLKMIAMIAMTAVMEINFANSTNKL